jgi:hypothetical protein
MKAQKLRHKKRRPWLFQSNLGKTEQDQSRNSNKWVVRSWRRNYGIETPLCGRLDAALGRRDGHRLLTEDFP